VDDSHMLGGIIVVVISAIPLQTNNTHGWAVVPPHAENRAPGHQAREHPARERRLQALRLRLRYGHDRSGCCDEDVGNASVHDAGGTATIIITIIIIIIIITITTIIRGYEGGVQSPCAKRTPPL
jgi:hypothetical protein